ncbi:DUF2071 domain-containing protein [Candidatus Sumerlaeota bacterium]|nr:DUF2071 domain-containing protein [Candidatus Sumerlaeota bacterium]
MTLPFLTAEWKNLILATWDIDPAALERRLAPGLVLDTRDGRAFVSLVAFDFLDTRVLGVPWPGYRNFPEINLRFYVRHGSERGVMFVREFVPQRLIAFMARAIYNEPYSSTSMIRRKKVLRGHFSLAHQIIVDGRKHHLRVTAEKESHMAAGDSTQHFFKEHQWGYGRSRNGKLIRYEVRHPHWRTHRVLQSQIKFGFAALYGSEFADLETREPISLFVAQGSRIAVYPKGTI